MAKYSKTPDTDKVKTKGISLKLTQFQYLDTANVNFSAMVQDLVSAIMKQVPNPQDLGGFELTFKVEVKKGDTEDE